MCHHLQFTWQIVPQSRYYSSFQQCLFVVFNNANAVSAEMWVWGFGNHSWNKSLLSSHLLTAFTHWKSRWLHLHILPICHIRLNLSIMWWSFSSHKWISQWGKNWIILKTQFHKKYRYDKGQLISKLNCNFSQKTNEMHSG